MNILIVGGTGVLSSAVVKEALKNNIKVTMINRGNKCVKETAGIEYIKSDKSNIIFIKEQLTGRTFDAVIDFLCFTKRELENSVKLYSNFTNQYVFISSCAVYKHTNDICDEDKPKGDPSWSYSINKYECEQLLVQLARQKNICYTIIRPAITYGDTRIPYGISPQYGYHWTLAARILYGKPVIRWNGGENSRNMMRVEDFAVGVVGIIGNPKAFNEAFNICGDEAPTYNDVLQAMSVYLGSTVKTIDITDSFYAEELPYRSEEILTDRAKTAFFSNKKIKKIVPSFRQTIKLNHGVTMTLDAYKENNFQYGIDWRFEGETDRVIRKWCKKNDIQLECSATKFIDYLGNATIVDRLEYLCAFYNISGLFVFVRKIKNKIKKIFV